MELCQQNRPRAAQLPSLSLGETVAPTAAPSVLPRLLPTPSLLTHKRDRAGDIGRTLKPIDAVEAAHRLGKHRQGVGHMQFEEKSRFSRCCGPVAAYC